MESLTFSDFVAVAFAGEISAGFLAAGVARRPAPASAAWSVPGPGAVTAIGSAVQARVHAKPPLGTGIAQPSLGPSVTPCLPVPTIPHQEKRRRTSTLWIASS